MAFSQFRVFGVRVGVVGVGGTFHVGCIQQRTPRWPSRGNGGSSGMGEEKEGGLGGSGVGRPLDPRPQWMARMTSFVC